MAKITVNFENTIGCIKPMHAVGQPPFTGGFCQFDCSPMQYLQEAHIPYSRLHDVGGPFGGNRFVDIPNIFRDFDADETDPACYDFAFTDALLAGMAEYDLKPIFRLGVTIENQCHIKAYHIYPPKDYAKWARICEHIIRHYNEGWADGFHYGIEYWEIWNEPDNGIAGKNQMWIGTNEQFYELYDVAAKHLKACFGDAIKVGGYGMCGLRDVIYHPEKYGMELSPQKPSNEEGVRLALHRQEFFFGFLSYIKEHQSPIDFFSWHSYFTVEQTLALSRYIRRTLDEYGYQGLETMLNEWNGPHDKIQIDTSYASAQAAAMLLGQQNEPVDMLCYYDSRYNGGPYGGFFHPITHQPTSVYYAFKAFGQLFEMGTQAEALSDTKGLYAIAACSNGKKALMIANITEEDQLIQTNLQGGTIYLIDEEHHLDVIQGDAATIPLLKDQTVYIEL